MDTTVMKLKTFLACLGIDSDAADAAEKIYSDPAFVDVKEKFETFCAECSTLGDDIKALIDFREAPASFYELQALLENDARFVKINAPSFATLQYPVVPPFKPARFTRSELGEGAMAPIAARPVTVASIKRATKRPNVGVGAAPRKTLKLMRATAAMDYLSRSNKEGTVISGVVSSYDSDGMGMVCLKPNGSDGPGFAFPADHRTLDISYRATYFSEGDAAARKKVATIVWQDGGWQLTQMPSRRPRVLVNNVVPIEPVTLHDGDVIWVGTKKYRIYRD